MNVEEVTPMKHLLFQFRVTECSNMIVLISYGGSKQQKFILLQFGGHKSKTEALAEPGSLWMP
jgi:hypothetical protein